MIAVEVSRSDHRTEVAAAFDAQASRYDETWTRSAVGRLQRQAVWCELDRLLRPRQRLLDLGCGTGADALHFARSGIRVHAVDLSPEMLAVARKRVQAENLSDLVTFELGALEDLAHPQALAPFDGAISNFGALNCVEDLRPVASSLAGLLRPGAFLALCYMGRFCLWETIWYLLHGQPGKAFRRIRGRKKPAEPRTVAARPAVAGAHKWRPNAPWESARTGTGPGTTEQCVKASLGSDHCFRVYYPSVSDVVSAFANDFRLVSFRGIGVLIPPSYMASIVNSFPGAFEAIASLDRMVRGRLLWRAIGDHRLLIFARR